MPPAIPSPIIVEEMAEWVALGGANFGIVGDASHAFGFHRAGFEISPSDYSRRHDPGLPFNMDWACAGDFAHNLDPRLRAMHVDVLRRLMTDDPALGMIDEFIGKPWPDLRVKYWARWNGTGNLYNYTGAGHDTWSHISWRRSRANERAYLWRQEMLTREEKIKLHTTAWFMQRGVIEQLDPVEIPPDESIPYYGAIVPNRLKQALDAAQESDTVVDVVALAAVLQDMATPAANAGETPDADAGETPDADERPDQPG